MEKQTSDYDELDEFEKELIEESLREEGNDVHGVSAGLDDSNEVDENDVDELDRNEVDVNELDRNENEVDENDVNELDRNENDVDENDELDDLDQDDLEQNELDDSRGEDLNELDQNEDDNEDDNELDQNEDNDLDQNEDGLDDENDNVEMHKAEGDDLDEKDTHEQNKDEQTLVDQSDQDPNRNKGKDKPKHESPRHKKSRSSQKATKHAGKKVSSAEERQGKLRIRRGSMPTLQLKSHKYVSKLNKDIGQTKYQPPTRRSKSSLRRTPRELSSHRSNLSSKTPPPSRPMGRRKSMGSKRRSSDVNSLIEDFETKYTPNRRIFRDSFQSQYTIPEYATPGRSLDAKRARKVAHEQAIMLENRVTRLKNLQDVYKKRIEQTLERKKKIEESKKRHEKDLIRRYEERLQKREEVKMMAFKNSQKADQRKLSIKTARRKCLLEKRAQAEREKQERERRKALARQEEKKLLRKKQKKIKQMEMERQKMRLQRQKNYTKKISKSVQHNRDAILFETHLRHQLNTRADEMCNEEIKMIQELKNLEHMQKKAVLELRNALSQS